MYTFKTIKKPRILMESHARVKYTYTHINALKWRRYAKTPGTHNNIKTEYYW